MRHSIQKKLTIAMMSIVMAMAAESAFAADTASHAVTVSVPNSLSITADTTNFTLTMGDYITGTESDTKTVVYTLRSNNNNIANGSAVLSGALGSSFTDLDLLADVGTYSKVGGNFSLVEAAAGDITIGTSATALANKSIDTGAGKVTRGTLPITYKAKATADLTSGSQTQTLTITIADA